MTKMNMGKFEFAVLSAWITQRKDAYGAEVEAALKKLMPEYESVSGSAVRTALYRLQDKGILISSLDTARPIGGGRPRRYFKISLKGLTVVLEFELLYRKIRQDVRALKASIEPAPRNALPPKKLRAPQRNR